VQEGQAVAAYYHQFSDTQLIMTSEAVSSLTGG